MRLACPVRSREALATARGSKPAFATDRIPTAAEQYRRTLVRSASDPRERLNVDLDAPRKA